MEKGREEDSECLRSCWSSTSALHEMMMMIWEVVSSNQRIIWTYLVSGYISYKTSAHSNSLLSYMTNIMTHSSLASGSFASLRAP